MQRSIIDVVLLFVHILTSSAWEMGSLGSRFQSASSRPTEEVSEEVCERKGHSCECRKRKRTSHCECDSEPEEDDSLLDTPRRYAN